MSEIKIAVCILTVAGLGLTAVGAWRAAKAVILNAKSEKDAVATGTTVWASKDPNET